MNDFRLTVGIEFDDKYIDAKNKLLEFVKALNNLTDAQKSQLAGEVIQSMGMAGLYEQFVRYMNNGGQV